MDKISIFVRMFGEDTPILLDIIKNVFVPILTSIIAFGGIALSVFFTSKDNKEKQRNELLIHAKSEVLKERLIYLKDIQNFTVILSENFIRIRFGIEEYRRKTSITLNSNPNEKDDIKASDDFKNIMSQFKIDSTSLLSKLNPESDESKPEAIIERALKDYEELCFRYIVMLDATDVGELYEEHRNPDIKLQLAYFEELENLIINAIRIIAKETWTQAKIEFDNNKDSK